MYHHATPARLLVTTCTGTKRKAAMKATAVPPPWCWARPGRSFITARCSCIRVAFGQRARRTAEDLASGWHLHPATEPGGLPWRNAALHMVCHEPVWHVQNHVAQGQTITRNELAQEELSIYGRGYRRFWTRPNAWPAKPTSDATSTTIRHLARLHEARGRFGFSSPQTRRLSQRSRHPNAIVAGCTRPGLWVNKATNFEQVLDVKRREVHRLNQDNTRPWRGRRCRGLVGRP
jgi:hypothetical protein